MLTYDQKPETFFCFIQEKNYGFNSFSDKLRIFIDKWNQGITHYWYSQTVDNGINKSWNISVWSCNFIPSTK